MQQRVIITGGAGSMAQALAEWFRRDGCEVLAPQKSELDVMHEESVANYFKTRPIDLLICAAGKISDAPLIHLSENTWDTLWNVNFLGAERSARHALPMMEKNRHGHVIFLSSFSALHPPPGQIAYASAKASLIDLTHHLAKKYGPSQIRVNTILPGFLETNMTRTVSPKRRQEILTDHTLGKLNSLSHVASFIHHLHHQMPCTSGQIFNLDSRII